MTTKPRPFQPTLSVITVVYNNAADIERTIRSVLSQTYPRIEYLIIDGGSTDGTVEIVHRFKEHIAVFVSEPDKGIYDAMNKGLARATGDYVLFMNSGDELYDAATVAEVFETSPDGDIYYGETELFDEQWRSLGLRRHRVPDQFSWRSFRYGMNVGHQAIYVRRSIAPSYDPRYKLSADVDWVIRAAKKSRKVVNVRRIVAKYLVGGMSRKRHKQSLIERFVILSRHYGWLPNLFNHGVIALRFATYFLRHGKPRA